MGEVSYRQEKKKECLIEGWPQHNRIYLSGNKLKRINYVEVLRKLCLKCKWDF